MVVGMRDSAKAVYDYLICFHLVLVLRKTLHLTLTL